MNYNVGYTNMYGEYECASCGNLFKPSQVYEDGTPIETSCPDCLGDEDGGPCKRCHGSGRVLFGEPCPACSGKFEGKSNMLKIKVGQLRRIIKEVVTEAYSGRGINLGYINANIAGDHRYTDSMHVDYMPDTDTVVVRVDVSSPIGGMDSFTPSDSSEQFRKELPADDLKGIMGAMKQALSDDSFNFKRYGKPTKKFYWNDDSLGPSLANLRANLDAARGG